MIPACSNCGSNDLRTYSDYDEKNERWIWKKGCNVCPWESRDTDEEKLHPEYYQRSELSPGRISKKDDVNVSAI